jgi:hypothetical protein
MIGGTHVFASESAAQQHLDGLIAADPNTAVATHVIPSFEGVGVPT